MEILDKLSSASTTRLANEVGLPRTTVGFVLNHLKKRGLVFRMKIQNHNEWSCIDSSELSKEFHIIAEKFDDSSNSEYSKQGSTQVKLFRGLKNIKELYKKILDTPGGSRVYIYQGSKSAELSLKKIEKGFLSEYHKKFKENRIIMEGFIGPKTIDLFKGLTTKEVRSHLDRMIVAYLVPDEYIDFDLDLLLLPKTLLLINLRREIAIEIRDEETVRATRKIFEFIKDKSNKLDINQEIKNVTGVTS